MESLTAIKRAGADMSLLISQRMRQDFSIKINIYFMKIAFVVLKFIRSLKQASRDVLGSLLSIQKLAMMLGYFFLNNSVVENDRFDLSYC
jgi:hypothetical protein